ncbi:MAG TPA: hypothetical protein VNH11_21035 [Pirellulales bacterium]|nr:hypothetical protein [Pirellulales bacterium]
MRRSSLLRVVGAIAASGSLLFVAATANAQVESLDPNPTLPAGVGSASDLEEYHHGSSAGAHIGRAIGGRVDGADENPADIMLRDIGGTNRGRRTGHAALRGRAVRDAQRIEKDGRSSPLGERGAVYFARRGDYENAIYAPRSGSYRQPAARRQPAGRSTNQR